MYKKILTLNNIVIKYNVNIIINVGKEIIFTEIFYSMNKLYKLGLIFKNKL